MKRFIAIMLAVISAVACQKQTTAPEVSTKDCLKFTSVGETTIYLQKIGSPYSISVQYYADSEGSWKDYSIGYGINLTDGQSVQFRAGEKGNASFNKDVNNAYYFTVVGKGTAKASGNIMSLLDPDCESLECPDNCFRCLFQDCEKLTTPPELPATKLGESCYRAMFDRCTGLVKAPELPATTLSNECYYLMFDKCSSLEAAPALLSTTLAKSCYYGMFNGCKNLKTIPSLNATTLADDCYGYMFSECTSITTAPDLPATTLAADCYEGMFDGCTSLTSAPDLKAATLVTECYSGMFNGCSKLNSIKMLATDISATDCMLEWTKGVAINGTFIKSKDATWDIKGASGIPVGWTVKTDATVTKLVAYYSFTGNSRTIAKDLQSKLSADILEVLPATDGINYAANNYATGAELINAITDNPNLESSYPAIKDISADFTKYSTVIIVTPLWWSHMAAPMQTFLFKYGKSLAGKKIGVVVKSSSSSPTLVVSDAKRLVPDGKFTDSSLWINDATFADRSNSISKWIAEQGL